MAGTSGSAGFGSVSRDDRERMTLYSDKAGDQAFFKTFSSASRPEIQLRSSHPDLRVSGEAGTFEEDSQIAPVLATLQWYTLVKKTRWGGENLPKGEF